MRQVGKANFDIVSNDINEKNYPNIGGVFGPVVVELVPYKKGLRPKRGVHYPTIMDLCQLAIQEPDLQRNCDVICFGSSFKNPDDHEKILHYPMLYGEETSRELITTTLEHEDAPLSPEEKEEGDVPVYYLIFHKPDDESSGD